MNTPYEAPHVESAEPPAERNRAFFERNELRETGWKLASMLFLYQGFSVFTGYWGTMSTGSVASRWPFVLLLVITIGVALACYFNSRRYYAFDGSKGTIDGPVVASLQSVLFSVLGLWMMVSNGPGIAFYLIEGFSRETITGASRLNIAGLSYSVLGTLFGFALFIGSAWFQRVWNNFRRYRAG